MVLITAGQLWLYAVLDRGTDEMMAYRSNTLVCTMTARFELRRPSQWKRVALLDALRRTHLATGAVVKALLDDIAGIQNCEKKRERTDRMQRLAYLTLRAWDLSSASAASARVDAMAMIESYVQSLGDGRASAGLPIVPSLAPLVDPYRDALVELASGVDQPREAELAAAVSRLARPPVLRPLSLHGYPHFYRLLRHPDTGRLFAWISLLPRSSRFARPQGELNRRRADAAAMVDIASGELVVCKKPTWILFPLSFGYDYQTRRFLDAGTPAGGRLVYRAEADRFELHAGFTFTAPAPVTRTYLGLDRGIYNLVGWSVCDANGRVIVDGEIDGMQLRAHQRRAEFAMADRQRQGRVVRGPVKRARQNEDVHIVANRIVDLAGCYGSQVVLAELTTRQATPVPSAERGGRRGRMLRRALTRQQYAKLGFVLGYKLPRAGLPAPIAVSGAFVGQTCPECGHIHERNRRRAQWLGGDSVIKDRFRCEACGHTAQGDRKAARMTALKGAWLKSLPTRAERGGRELTDDERLPAFLARAAKARRDAPA